MALFLSSTFVCLLLVYGPKIDFVYQHCIWQPCNTKINFLILSVYRFFQTFSGTIRSSINKCSLIVPLSNHYASSLTARLGQPCQ